MVTHSPTWHLTYEMGKRDTKLDRNDAYYLAHLQTNSAPLGFTNQNQLPLLTATLLARFGQK